VRFRFWGVRGSTPTPLTVEAFQARISTILHRARPEDLAGPESRERFLASLPPELFGLVGGNTTCLEIEGSGDDVLIVDGGTGLRELGVAHETGNSRPKHYHLFLTHFHYDHLQGLPFFPGFVHPRNRVTLYSPVKGFEELIHRHMREPFFPIPFSIFPAQIRFVELGTEPVTIGETTVRWKAVYHPGTCHGYRFDRQGRSLVFSTDTELRSDDFARTEANREFFGGADALILDSQYTLAEALERPDWGHSSSSLAVDFALDFGAKRLYLFHHEPAHDDAKVEEIRRLAQWYADHRNPGALKVLVAREGREGVLP
jgi:phosphoribosyl 1,2-cyclic phosphodiesterase